MNKFHKDDKIRLKRDLRGPVFVKGWTATVCCNGNEPGMVCSINQDTGDWPGLAPEDLFEFDILKIPISKDQPITTRDGRFAHIITSHRAGPRPILAKVSISDKEDITLSFDEFGIFIEGEESDVDIVQVEK